MSDADRQNMSYDIADFVSDNLRPLVEHQGNQIVDLLRDNGHDFFKSRASQRLRMMESTACPSSE
jgi:hypothetical protein